MWYKNTSYIFLLSELPEGSNIQDDPVIRCKMLETSSVPEVGIKMCIL